MNKYRKKGLHPSYKGIKSAFSMLIGRQHYRSFISSSRISSLVKVNVTEVVEKEDGNG